MIRSTFRQYRISGATRKCLQTTLQFQDFDEAYLERLCSGDFRTEQHFVAYFSELMRLKLRAKLRSPQAIEDVRQETFARIFASLRKGPGLRQPERLGAFVNSTCNNVLLEYYRAFARDGSVEEGQEYDIADTSASIVDEIAGRELQARVHDVLEELPEKDRRLLKEVFIDERDKDEVCREFGVDRNYLRVLLHRAKQSFKIVYSKVKATRPVAAEHKRL